jgi:uncharacterized protein YdaL
MVRGISTAMKSPLTTRRALFRGLPVPVALSALALLAGAFFLLESKEAGSSRSGPRILVLYDRGQPWAWLGDIYSLKLENLLGHFDARVTRKPLSDYNSADIDSHDATFYLASSWREGPLDFLFNRELERTSKPFIWVGLNLWQYGWDFERDMPSESFVSNYGFSLDSWSGENHPLVIYKNTELKKEPFDPGLTRIEIVNTAKVHVHAICRDMDGREWPYVVQSGNFWFVGDMPMISTTYENRSLAFADLLHEMLGIPHEENHRAYFRIEDVSPVADVETLQKLGATLEEIDTPFTVALIPEYRDWSGVYNGGTLDVERITEKSPVTREIQHWIDIGAQVLQHGTTHQADGILNPYTGASGDDYEFYRVSADELGFLTLVGPVMRDSRAWARSRANRGLNILKSAGIRPVAWLTPHGLASPADYKAIAEIHPIACDRAVFFFEDAQGNSQATELNAPFVYKDTYGLARIPETLGQIDPWGWHDIQPPSLPADLVRRAKALKVVRDGWAGFYCSWYLDPELIRETVEGIKAIGYKFTPISSALEQSGQRSAMQD